MNRISKSLLSLSLLLSLHNVFSYPYWPDNKDFGYLLPENVELALQRLALHNVQKNSCQPIYQREIKQTYRVGDPISIITPYDGRGDFCRWHFLFGGKMAGYEEGVQKLLQSGLVSFSGFTFDNRMCTEVWSNHFPCESVDQMTINFLARRPGKIIFYMKNREYQNYTSNGCDCKPTVTKFEIEIVDNYNSTYYIQ